MNEFHDAVKFFIGENPLYPVILLFYANLKKYGKPVDLGTQYFLHSSFTVLTVSMKENLLHERLTVTHDTFCETVSCIFKETKMADEKEIKF